MTSRIIAGGPGEFMTVRELIATGSQTSIGHAVATAALTEHDWRPRPATTWLARARRRWFEREWPQHHARMRGTAEALGIDPDADLVHVDGLSSVPTGSACSASYCLPSSTVGGHGLLGRNYDFFTASATELFGMLTGEPVHSDKPPMASAPYLITSRPDDGPATTVLTMNELDGCMDGINEHGLTVVLLIADAATATAPVDAEPQVGLSSAQLPRFLLDTCRTSDEAKQALLGAKQYDLGVPLHYLIADAHGDAFVWERGRGGVEHILEPSGSTLCVTNHPLHEHPEPDRLPADNTETMATYRRYQELAKNTTTGEITGDRLRAAMDTVRFTAENAIDYPIRTLWRTILDPAATTMSTHFYLGDNPDGTPRYSSEVTVSPTGQP
ncbi:C45 family peptidase [Sciscionella sediminilitoris]|uniref:C45 family peptidase n=1 Tax=Sciscionella sediminilitoris TaxID=1445613 RepID=UPI0004DF1F03|nr:C45 family peptidase [Sciscionella sp. SE31]